MSRQPQRTLLRRRQRRENRVCQDNLSELFCDAGSGGNFTWHAGLDCTEGPCPNGACCEGDPAVNCNPAISFEADCTAEWYWGGDCLAAFDCACNLCDVGSLPEGEPPCGPGYEDTINGGCNSTPPVFSVIQCGETICGESGFYEHAAECQLTEDCLFGEVCIAGECWTSCVTSPDCPAGETCSGGVCSGGPRQRTFRDTDWYEVITVGQSTTLNFTVNSGFAPVIGFIANDPPGSSDCAGVSGISPFATPDACVDGTVSITVGPGHWWMFVAPPLGDDPHVECGSLRYNATLDCVFNDVRDLLDTNLIMQIEIDEPWWPFPGGLQETVAASGCTTALRDPPPYVDDVDIETEIIAMDLVGSGPLLGAVEVQERSDAESLGLITGVVTDGGGNLTGGDASFGVFPKVIIDLGDGPLNAFTQAPVPIGTSIGALPPLGSTFLMSGAPVPIFITVCTPPPGGGRSTDDYIYDDLVSDNAIGLTSGGDMAWIHHFDRQLNLEQLTAISTCFGTPTSPGGSGVVAGQAFRVHLWSDPNGDGHPSDAVLIESVPSLADAGSIETDVLQKVLIGPHLLPESFFIGASIEHVAGTFPGPLDQTEPLDHEAWADFNDVPYDPTQLGGPNTVNLDDIGLSGDWLLRGNATGGNCTDEL
ncbi:MAG: hypothetical protein ACYSVY_28705, partial [Planctomycetota bacterium]